MTELVARPLLNLHWPQLAGFVQPLGGEYAARRSLLEQLPFPSATASSWALLVDALDLVGLDALAQVDLGVRLHRHQDDAGAGPDGRRDLAGSAAPAGPRGRTLGAHGLGATIAQFERDGDELIVVAHDVTAPERPPIMTVPGYTLDGSRAAS